MQSKEYKLPNGKIAVFEYDICKIGKVTLESMDELMSMIANRPHGEWIPCSKKMPEESGPYLTWSAIGFVPDHVDEQNTYEGIAIANYSKDSCDWFGTEKVYAWMPLPDPWEGADDEIS